MCYPIAFVETTKSTYESSSPSSTRMWHGWIDAPLSASPSIMGTTKFWLARTIPVWPKYTYTTQDVFTIYSRKYLPQDARFRRQNYFRTKSISTLWTKLEA